MICQNCGNENERDATFCEKCGANLKQSTIRRGPPSPPTKSEGMATSTKVLIVAVVVLVASLGVAAGVLMQMDKNTNPVANNSQVSSSQTPVQVTYKADWHQITSYSGTIDDYRSFQTKGQRFKVVMSATPLLNYNTNFMNVDISGANAILASGNLNWGPTESLSTKQKTIEVNAPAGVYYSQVTTQDLQSWTVTIYDYY